MLYLLQRRQNVLLSAVLLYLIQTKTGGPRGTPVFCGTEGACHTEIDIICMATRERQGLHMKMRKRWIAAGTALLCALALGAAGLLRGVQLVYTVLDGRRVRPQEEIRMTDGTLYAQMMHSQAQARTQGWQTVIPTEEITLNAPRGTLYARLFAPLYEDEDAPWALVLHGGLGTDHTDVLDMAGALSMEGYRVLAPDLYAHGRSAGSCTSLGLREAEDVHAWVSWMLERDGDAQIVIWAQEEGAAAALLAAGALPGAVRAIACDSAYASIRARAHQLLEEHTKEKGSLLRLDGVLMEIGYRLLHGADIRTGELEEAAKKAPMPLLLLHGTLDQDVPAWHSEDLAAAAGEGASLHFAEGAAHGVARYAKAQDYAETLMDFYRHTLERNEGGAR